MVVDKSLYRVLTNIDPCVVSKSDSDHGTATTATEPAGTICRSNLSLGYYPLHRLYSWPQEVWHHAHKRCLSCATPMIELTA